MNNLTGKIFGRLTAVRLIGTNRNKKRLWLCICVCGKERACIGAHLNSGLTTSCGCSKLKHGHSGRNWKSKTYHAWQGMKHRCLNPNNKYFKIYGGRGVKVCPRWENSFQNFLDDIGAAPKGLQLDRINNDGDYEPGNCRWATPKENSNNKSNSLRITYLGENVTPSRLSELTGVSINTIRGRIRLGFSDNDIASKKKLYSGSVKNER